MLKVKKAVEDPHRITAPVYINPHLPNISQTLKKHHKAMLKNAPYLGEMFKSPPMASYRQPPNLRRMVCKSKLFPVGKNKKLMRGTHKMLQGGRNVAKTAKFAHSL